MEKVKKLVKCDRCGGRGLFAVGIHNDQYIWAQPDAGVCYKCGGSGKMTVTETIRTPEEQARYEKAKVRREAKARAEWEAAEAERQAAEAAREAERMEAERVKEEERVAKLHHGFVGDIASKIDIPVTGLYRASYEVKSFSGFGMSTMRIYAFEDEQRRLIIWKTSSFMEFEAGQQYRLAGTVKAHDVYREEDQTLVNRPKITKIA